MNTVRASMVFCEVCYLDAQSGLHNLSAHCLSVHSLSEMSRWLVVHSPLSAEGEALQHTQPLLPFSQRDQEDFFGVHP